MRDPELSGDVTGPDAELGELDDAYSNVVGQRPPVHEHPTKLVHLTILAELWVWKQRSTTPIYPSMHWWYNFRYDFPTAHVTYACSDKKQ